MLKIIPSQVTVTIKTSFIQVFAMTNPSKQSYSISNRQENEQKRNYVEKPACVQLEGGGLKRNGVSRSISRILLFRASRARGSRTKDGLNVH